MCDMGEDETVEHVTLKCEKYDSNRMQMMHVVLTDMDVKWMKWLRGLPMN